MTNESEDSLTYRDGVFRRHIEEHARKPVVGLGCQQVRRDPELGAAEGCRYRIAAETNRVVAGHRLVVTGGDAIDEKCDVDVRLADEQGLHGVFRMESP
jgi:hypothetical protein